MKILSGVLAGALVLGLAAEAQAQVVAPPQVPNPANPFPENPIATDGTPLPHAVFANPDGVLTGRSAYVGPVDGLVGNAVGAGLGVAGGAVDAGVGTVNGVTGDALR